MDIAAIVRNRFGDFAALIIKICLLVDPPFLICDVLEETEADPRDVLCMLAKLYKEHIIERCVYPSDMFQFVPILNVTEEEKSVIQQSQ